MAVVIDGTNGISSPDYEVDGVTGQIYPLVSGTAVTASGTAVNFTGIPSWAKRITVMLSGVSTNGTSVIQVQLGDSGGVETTGYTAMVANVQTTSNTTRGVTATTGFILQHANSAAEVLQGAVVLCLLGSNTWVCNGALYNSAGTAGLNTPSGSKALSDTLTQVRITTVNGTDTFDAGTINIIYE